MSHTSLRWSVLLVVAVTTFGCDDGGGDERVLNADDMHVDVSGIPGADTTIEDVSDSSSDVDGVQMMDDTLTDVEEDTEMSPIACDMPRAIPGTGSLLCCEDVQRRLPTEFPTVIDLSDVSMISRGTCGDLIADREGGRELFPGHWLPTDPADYPVKIILPASPGMDPDCAALCEANGDTTTAFGIAFEGVQGTIDEVMSPPWSVEGPLISVTVPEPWFFVSGGCGEACSWTCLGGYQEFGEPRRCATPAHLEGLGFATGDPMAPSVEAIIELIDIPADIKLYERYTNACCVYPEVFE